MNKPTIPLDPVIVHSSHNSIVDRDIFIDPPSPTELIFAMKRIKSERAAGICDITPELLTQCGSVGIWRRSRTKAANQRLSPQAAPQAFRAHCSPMSGLRFQAGNACRHGQTPHG